MKLFKKINQYALICYAVNDKKVVYCDTFYSLKKAKKELNEIVKGQYEWEKQIAELLGLEHDIHFKLEDKYALLEIGTLEDTFIWRFEIKKCNVLDETIWEVLREYFYDFIEKFNSSNNT